MNSGVVLLLLHLKQEVSLGSPDYPGTHCVDQTHLELSMMFLPLLTLCGNTAIA